MTIIDEISICANQLANKGKKPTVALVKAKLTQPASLATIINALKNWQHKPDFIDRIGKAEQQKNKVVPTNDTSALLESLLTSGTVKKIIEQSIERKTSEIRKELEEMKLLIQHLTEQLEQSK